MKKNKKGFTLIELLAVLVVLAILALISVPIVLNIINQSREKARARSMEGYAKAVESAVYIYQMDHTGVSDITLEENYIVSSSDLTDAGDISSVEDQKKQKVEYSGSSVTDCTLSLANNKVTLSGCKVDGNGTYGYSNGSGSKTS